MRREQSCGLLGTSSRMAELWKEIRRIAASDSKVLITGESGVGKELVARAIHDHSDRSSRPFVAVNCAGLPETLLESELFGHVKGSFTGAHRDRSGKLEAANRGTILLDEIGDMPLRMQGLLLRFFGTGEVQKVGMDGVAGVVDVRVIAATNRDLTNLVAEGGFREDLFYRIAVINLAVPPLRERSTDVPVLVEHFLTQFTANNGCTAKGITPEAIEALKQYAWPGNVRELANLVERLVVNARHDMVTVGDIPREIREAHDLPPGSRKERRRTVTDDLYRRLTQEHESFWAAVYPLYMRREITKAHVRDLVTRGLKEARGSYQAVLRLFNMEPRDYRRFLNFLRKHDCQLRLTEHRKDAR